MNHRDRFYAVLRGERADRIPFVGRMTLFYNRLQSHPHTVPVPFRGLSLGEMVREFGWGLYGHKARIFRSGYDSVEVSERWVDGLLRTEYHTPVGTVWRTQVQNPGTMRDAGANLWDVERPFKSESDYPVLAHIFEHLTYRPTYEEVEAQEKELGAEGVSRCSVGKCPMHQIMESWMGYERAIYELNDRTARVEELQEILTTSYRRMQQIVLASPADIVLTGSNFTTMVTSPPLFRRYFLPYFVDFNTHLIEAGKYPMAHVDGELGGPNGGLLPLIREARFRIADAFTPPPATTVTVREALDAWENEVMVFGGIPSMMFGPGVSDAEFEAYVTSLLRSIRPEDRFALGFGDMVAMDASFDRVQLMARLYAEHGEYAN